MDFLLALQSFPLTLKYLFGHRNEYTPESNYDEFMPINGAIFPLYPETFSLNKAHRSIKHCPMKLQNCTHKFKSPIKCCHHNQRRHRFLTRRPCHLTSSHCFPIRRRFIPHKHPQFKRFMKPRFQMFREHMPRIGRPYHMTSCPYLKWISKA